MAAIHGIEPVGDKEGTIRCHGHVRGAVVAICLAADNIDDGSGIAGAGLLRGECPDHVTPRLGVDHLAAKGLG